MLWNGIYEWNYWYEVNASPRFLRNNPLSGEVADAIRPRNFPPTSFDSGPVGLVRDVANGRILKWTSISEGKTENDVRQAPEYEADKALGSFERRW